MQHFWPRIGAALVALTASQTVAALSPYPAPPPNAYWAYTPPYADYPRRPYAPFGGPAMGYAPYRNPAHRRVPVQPTQRPAPATTAAPRATEQTSPGAPDPQPSASTSPKDAFIARLQPLIADENRRLRALRHDTQQRLAILAQGDTPDNEQRSELQALARRYRVDGDILDDASAQRELLLRIDEIPASLAVAQAANESAWGTSRFAREANNLFGIWTYDEDKGIVPLKRAPGKTHLVRKFSTEAESIRYYMLTLNSHPAYAELRNLRAKMRAQGQALDGHALASGLDAYSAKGDEYVQLIQQMIRRLDTAAVKQAGKDSA